jgi:AraC-like DNA-binding protein
MTPSKFGSLSPLYRNCLFRSDERVEVHDHVARELIDHQVRWKQGSPDAAMFKGHTRRLRMYLLQYGAQVEVTPRPFDDFVLVHTSIVGGAEIESDDTRLEVTEGRSAVLAPRRRVRLRWYPGTQQLIVKVPHALIREVAASEDVDLVLASGALLERGLSSQWSFLARSLLNVMSMEGEVAVHSEWLDHFERNVALFLLSHQSTANGGALPVAHRAAVADGRAAEVDPFAGGDARMEAVTRYIESRLCAPISLEDLARVARVSVRRLNELCHRYHGVTPMELLRNMRLDAAHSRLRMQPEFSVTETALALGFTHLGRFSHYYQGRFGELPRQTQTRRGA